MEPWEHEERKWRIIRYAAGCLIGAAILFVVLRFVVRFDHGKVQDPFSLICAQAIRNATQAENSK